MWWHTLNSEDWNRLDTRQMDGSRTLKKIFKGKIYGNQTGEKPQER
jgi:hypothetical protein